MTVVTLSRRNLLTLLAKLHIPGSHCAIIKPGGTTIVAESDEVHYAGRRPGPMSLETEFLAGKIEEAIQAAQVGSNNA